MADMIDRQAAIDAVYKCTDIFINNLPVMVDKADAYKALAELPSAQPAKDINVPTNRWIPCSERLPKSNTDVLVSDGKWNVVIARVENLWDGEREEPTWWIPGYGEIDAWAWMPLPEPWRGEEYEL